MYVQVINTRRIRSKSNTSLKKGIFSYRFPFSTVILRKGGDYRVSLIKVTIYTVSRVTRSTSYRVKKGEPQRLESPNDTLLNVLIDNHLGRRSKSGL